MLASASAMRTWVDRSLHPQGIRLGLIYHQTIGPKTNVKFTANVARSTAIAVRGKLNATSLKTMSPTLV